MKTRAVWFCEWGEFEIPDDVPRVFRKDGWFDGRRKLSEQAKAYFAAMAERVRNEQPIQSWAEWSA